MKTFRFIGMALIAVCVSFASCSSDDEDKNVYYAYGIRLGDLSPETEQLEVLLKINEVEQWIEYKTLNAQNYTLAQVTEFHTFTEKVYFEIINHCDMYVKEEITKENLFEKLPELPYNFDFLWQCLGQYEYIAYFPRSSMVYGIYVYNKTN